MVVTIIGILATLATYSVRERVYEAHSIEALRMLGSIRAGVTARAEKLSGSGNMLEIGGRVDGFGSPLGLPGVLGNGKTQSLTGSQGSNGSGTSLNDTTDSTGEDNDGDNGHGNSGGCDPSNPGVGGPQCDGSTSQGSSQSGQEDPETPGNGAGGGFDDPDGDGDHGHGNSGGCDPSNPSSACPPGAGGMDADPASHLCGSAVPVPKNFSSVKARTYQSTPGDWAQGNEEVGWPCLHVTMNQPQRYQYGYDVGTSSVPTINGSTSQPTQEEASSFSAWARGDLDGDDRIAWFVLTGRVIDGQLAVAPAVSILDQNE